MPRVPQFRIVPPAACCRDLSPFLIVPPSILPRFPLLRISVSSYFALGTLPLCAAETFQKCGKVLHLLSKLSDFTILIAWRSSRNAFCCIGRPQVRSVFLLVFCPGCRQHRVKELSPIRLWHRSPDCQVAVTPPDTIPEPSSATTVEKSKTKQRHDVTIPCTQCVFSFHQLNNLSHETENVQHRHSAD